ncbi:MAG: LUD domain-containing protein [Daejeonella sp.]|uniref:LutC/YkgG family protein n=1 Tax=Daejeonella sp. TaxID=2805397 RepID=UPI0027371ABD|nr:LUD domain-containing protein [Daejeonella sp.]MDP3467841.1 LUD domain-containing protein [Daejeonella sp.]
MGARETILNAVAMNKPDLTELPDIDLSLTIQYTDLIQKFIEMVEAAGGKAYYENSRQQLLNDLAEVKAEGKFMINLLDNRDTEGWKNLNAGELESLDTCYLRAGLGVAENGAMWISERQMSNRLLPFICQHLVIVLNQADIVNNMHQAYQQIDAAEEGFGVFIAGPSKTADIEQNLVIGAHGARSLRVYVI